MGEFMMLRYIILLCTIFYINSFAAPKADLWQIWKKHNASNTQTIDHTLWDNFLKENLITTHSSGIYRFDYTNVSKKQRVLLQTYLKNMQNTNISNFNRAEQMAYWVNLYNARTVELILEHYPVKSITKIKFGWFDFGPWDEEILKVEDKELSLNDIEHRILRPIYKDERIHYIVNCASLGCPNIPKNALTSENMESTLQQATIEYVNHERAVKIIDDDTLQLSSIYDCYGVDFGKNEKEVITKIAKDANPKLASWLKANPEPDIEYEYDWGLNDILQ